MWLWTRVSNYKGRGGKIGKSTTGATCGVRAPLTS